MRQKVTGFIGPSYKLRADNLETQRTVNLYPEMSDSVGKDGSVVALLSTPGKRLLATLLPGPIRGIFSSSNNRAYVVSGNNVYRISADWSYQKIGTLSSSVGRVSFADNGTMLVIVDGSSGYYGTFASNTITQISDPNFLGASTVAFLDGYFVFNKPNSDYFFVSGLYDTVAPSFDALDIARVEASPDYLVAIIQNNRELWMFGTRTIEIYYNSGNVDGVPFDRQPGVVIGHGISTFSTVAQLNNTLLWLGSGEKGSGIVWMANGYTPQRISNHAVEYAIQSYAVAGATSYAYEQEGHYFFCLNFPAANTTWCYDITTQIWHERAYLNINTGELERDRAEVFGFIHGTRVVGDYESGKLYELDLDYFLDDTDQIARIRTSPHLAAELDYVFYNSFQLDIQAGVGLDGIAQGTDPQAMLTWSDDGGKTWSNEHWVTIGPIGNYRARVIWRRLGRARDRVWRVTITDPIKVALIAAYYDATKGNR